MSKDDNYETQSLTVTDAHSVEESVDDDYENNNFEASVMVHEGN